MNSRLETFRTMIARQPDHAMARFGLATELAKAGEHAEAVEHFAQYLARARRRGERLDALRRVAARRRPRPTTPASAITRGIDAATRYAHSGLVADLEALQDAMD